MDILQFRKIEKQLARSETVLVRLKTKGPYWSSASNKSKYAGSIFEVVKIDENKRTVQVTADGLGKKLNYKYQNLVVENSGPQATLPLTSLIVVEKKKEKLPIPTDTAGRRISAKDAIAFSHTDGHMALGLVKEIDSENRVVWEVIQGTTSLLSSYRKLEKGKILKTRNPHEKMVII